MNILLTEQDKGILKYILATLVVALVFSGITYYYTAKHYQEKYDALNKEYTDFKAVYSDVVKEKEDALIAVSLAEKKAKTPLIETVKGETQTIIQYVEKESSSDASIEISSKQNPISISYNGQKQELSTTTTEGKEIKDGKVVVTQQSSATIDIDSIVKREIANTILDKDHEIAVLKRQKTQQTGWGFLIGVGAGAVLVNR